MNRTFDLIWLRIREYFKHPAEDIRQARPIVPGRLYSNFGYICKAVPLTKAQREYLQTDQKALPSCLFYDRPILNPERLHQLHEMVAERTDTPLHCEFCDFYRLGIPCPFYNTLKNGSVVCHTHRYVILKNQRS